VSGGDAGNTPLAQITESPAGGSTTTQIGDIRAGRDIHIGASPAELVRLTEVFSNQIGVSTEALAKAEARAADLATQLGFTVEAVIGFFRAVGEQEVPLEKVPAKLAEIAAQHRGGPREAKPSIAVLPFQNMSGDPTQEYFSDGMVDEITTALSRVRWLHVVSRNSSFTYKGQAIDIRQVGRELGVGYVLEGSVRKSGNRVRISAQLIEAETDVNLWADHFDGH
jgi:TolB-like protein